MDNNTPNGMESAEGSMNIDDLKEWAATHQDDIEKIVAYLESIGKLRRNSDGSIDLL